MKRTRSAVLATTSVLALSLAACGGGESGGGSADGGEFTPRGDVTMIVPFGAGGGSDLAGHATEAVGGMAHRAFVAAGVGRDAFERNGVDNGVIAGAEEERG